MKRIIMRFWDGSSALPVNSEDVTEKLTKGEWEDSEVASSIKDWMLAEPNGKVDFVWGN